MNREDIRKLLGGYATNTLTDTERQALFAAALDDQELFDALGDEQVLREFLADPRERAALREHLETPDGLWKRLAAWWRRPMPLALAGTLAGALIVGLAIHYTMPNRLERSTIEAELASGQVTALSPGSDTAEAVSPDSPPATPAPKKPAAVARRDAPAPKPAENEFRQDTLASAELRKAQPEPEAPLSEGKDAKAEEVAAAPAPAPPAGGRRATVADQAKTAAPAMVGLSRQKLLRSEADEALKGRVTDVNASILTLNVGSNAGVRVAERLEVLRQDQILGSVEVTKVGQDFAVGRFTPLTPQAPAVAVGDRVRRTTSR